MSRPVQRGLALLMALATVVLVLAGLTAAVAALRGVHQAAWTSTVDAHLYTGLRQGEALASSWLLRRSADLVLPPEGGGTLVADDRLVLPSGAARISVVAYDGLAGVPIHLAQRGGPLRAALPADLAELAVPAVARSDAEAGRAAHLLDILPLPAGALRFPAPPPGPARVWRSSGVSEPLAPPSSAAAAGPDLANAIAFLSDGRINLNTAPEPLLRSAYGALRLGGVDEVLENRRRLQPSAAPALAGPDGLRLVARSDRWQMLITVSWQDISRAWWVVFTGTGPTHALRHRHDAAR